MRHKLTELMVRIMSLSCGIEEEQRFYRVALAEVYHCFETQTAQLFIKNDDAEHYDQLAHYPKNQESTKILFTGGGLETDPLRPLLRETPKSTRLLLPLKDEKSPLMLLCLNWQDSPPPEWVRNEELLIAFSKKLGSYLPWKHVMLKIASAKRNLEAIFDHLPGAVSVINSDHTIERVNKAFTKLFDIPFSEAVGKKCYQVVHQSTLPHPDCRMLQAMETRDKMSIETENGRRLRVTLLPLAAQDNKLKSLQIFQLQDDPQGTQKTDESYDFLQLYSVLSQPLTVLSLMSGMMATSKESINVQHLDIIEKEINTIMMILREAYVTVTFQSGATRGLNLKYPW